MENNFSSASSSNSATANETTTTTTTTTTNFTTFTNQQLSQPSMGYTQNSQQYLPSYYHHQNMQFPYIFPLEQQPGQSFVPDGAYPVYPVWFGQNGIQNGDGNNNVIPAAAVGSWVLQPNTAVAKEPQRTVFDPQKTKIARIKRKLARQKSLSLQRNASSSSSSSSSSSTASSSGHLDARRLTMSSAVDSHRDLFNFCTLHNKRLRVLLKKELKNSDVGSLGRIILPKREAEENLPSLSDKEGMHVVFRDICSDKFWTLKFKYWSNNKSRMYVLENSGDFVKQNGMEIGDSLTLYEDESKNLYFSIKKVERPAAEGSHNQQHQYSNHNNNNNDNSIQNQVIIHQARDEEEASLALLIEQLKHREQQEPYYYNLIMTLPMDDDDDASLHREAEEEEAKVGSAYNNNAAANHDSGSHAHLAATSFSHSNNRMKDADDHHHHQSIIDDCFGCFDMLPDIDTL